MKDKVVAEIYETMDYGQFAIMPENRGQKETGGISQKKVNKFIKTVEDGSYDPEISLVRVNKDGVVVDGAHTLTGLMQLNMPVRYMIVKSEKFNGVSNRTYLANMFQINASNPSWSNKQMFNAAVQSKSQLAIYIAEMIEKHGNVFEFTDVLALLTQDELYFTGNMKNGQRIPMTIFDDKKLKEAINSREFKNELDWFVKINQKARIAVSKRIFLRCCYAILNHCLGIVKEKAFRNAAMNIRDSWLQSARTKKMGDCIKMLIEEYNSTAGASIKHSAIAHQIRSKEEHVGAKEVAL